MPPGAALNDRVALIADAAGIGLWWRELDSGALFWSTANRALNGIAPDEAPPSWSEYLDDFVNPEDRARFLNEVAQADVAGRPVQHTDYRVRGRDGRERWIYSWAAREVRDGRRFAFGVNVDVTDRHVAETERRERERAEQARRAQSALLARVSHELRTPMNAVLGFADLLLADARAPLAPRQAERVEQIRQAGRHLLALIDDLLGLAAADADERAPAWDAVNPAHTVQRVLAWVRPLAERHEVQIWADAPRPEAGPAHMRADARWLTQVATNLLTNAIKYNRRGGWVRVSIARRGADDGRAACVGLVVTDSGRGLDEAQQRRLFEPFERFGAEQEGITGSGIGLAIVRRLVERMGGAIEVRSQPGEGSEFRVWLDAAAPAERGPAGDLPSRPGGAGPDAHAQPEPAIADAEHAPGCDLDVLCIEDNPVNREIVAALLGLRSRVTLRTAPDGTSGLALAAQRLPDLVLLDMQLPDLHGHEVLRRLRNLAPREACRVIALSADALPDSVAAAREAGFDDYWTKPIEFGRFMAGIDALAAQARSERRSSGPA
jgi:signal transduction histidine kinase/ActR/RegA family two-component response regulator